MPTLAHFSRIDVDYTSFALFYYISGACYILAFFMALIRDKYVAPIVEVLGAGFASLVPMFIASYLAYTFDLPLADNQLIAMDKVLGFNWFAFIYFVDSSQRLSNWLEIAYGSLKYQLVLVPIFLCFLGQVPRAISYIFGYALMVLIASVIAVWYPALGTYSVYGLDVATLQNIDVKFGFHFLDQFNALREGRSFVLSGPKAAGIVTFPSVHAGMGFFTIWALWKTGLLKWPCLVLNISMAVSAVSHANHYLVDVIAGFGIAAITVVVVSYLILGQRFAQREKKFNYDEILVVNSKS